MNYSENYLKGANALDSEMEQFDHNPSDYAMSMGWTETMQNKAEGLRNKLILTKDDYLKLEKIINKADGDIEDDSVQDYITNLFATKLLNSFFPKP